MSQNPDGSFTVTLADVYSELRKLADEVQKMSPQAGVIADHESRIRSLERWKYALPTSLVVALLSAIADTIVLIR